MDYKLIAMITLQDKEIAICEMLGAVQNCYYHNKQTDYKSIQMEGDIVEKLRKFSGLPIGEHIRNGVAVEHLRFHCDANWQMLAINHIHNLGFTTSIFGEWLNMQDYLERIIHHTFIVRAYGDHLAVSEKSKESRIVAIFEGLYKFSEYLKS